MDWETEVSKYSNPAEAMQHPFYRGDFWVGVLKDKGWTGGGESEKAVYSEGTAMRWDVEARMCKQYIRNFKPVHIIYTGDDREMRMLR